MRSSVADNPQRLVGSLAAYLDVLAQGQSDEFASVRERPVVVKQHIPISDETGSLYVEVRVQQRSSARGGHLYECLISVRLEPRWTLIVTASGVSVHKAVVAAAGRAVRGAESRLDTNDNDADPWRALANGDDS